MYYTDEDLGTRMPPNNKGSNESESKSVSNTNDFTKKLQSKQQIELDILQ
jgi:hypothetical protein